MVKMNIEYTSSVTKQVKNKLKKDIINAIEGSPEMRKEIRKVFQQANRRIQNVEKAGVFSPAVAALGKGEVKGYSKFSVKGFGNEGASWQALKREYAKAVSFLNQPTSSATGAKQFEAQVKKEMNITDDLWSNIRETILEGYNSVSDELLLALPYSDFMQEVYSRAADSSSTQMERDAVEAAEAIQKNINDTAEQAANAVVEGVDEMVKSLAKGFKIDF